MQLLATNAMKFISNKRYSCEKQADSLRDNRNPPTYPSPSLPAKPADTLTESSSQKKYEIWTRNSYSGLHEYE